MHIDREALINAYLHRCKFTRCKYEYVFRITAGLGVLVPALQQEPKGARRDLLRKEVTVWMEVAERLKQDSYKSQEVELCAEVNTVSSGSEEREKNSCKIQ